MGGRWFDAQAQANPRQIDKKLMDMGCARKDMFSLERQLEVKLFAIDTLGNTLWEQI